LVVVEEVLLTKEEVAVLEDLEQMFPEHPTQHQLHLLLLLLLILL